MKKIIALVLLAVFVNAEAESTANDVGSEKFISGNKTESQIQSDNEQVHIKMKDTVHHTLDELFNIEKVRDRRSNEVDIVNHLPAPSAGPEPTQGCKYSQRVLQGKILKFKRLVDEAGLSRQEFEASKQDIQNWQEKVALNCQ